MEIISNKKNQINPSLSLDDGNRAKMHQKREENLEFQGGIIDNEQEYKNAFVGKGTKRQNIEFQGAFKKIKSSMFDRELEEVIEAWLINMSKYIYIYQYDENIKTGLEIY